MDREKYVIILRDEALEQTILEVFSLTGSSSLLLDEIVKFIDEHQSVLVREFLIRQSVWTLIASGRLKILDDRRLQVVPENQSTPMFF